MTAIDTNLIVRLLANDDPDQTTRAARLLKENQVFVATTVILETEWVLRSAYRADRGVIQQSLRKFMALPNVFIEHEAAVLQALEAHAAGMDFADALHLASACGRATRFATFDQPLRRRAASQHGAIPVFEPP